MSTTTKQRPAAKSKPSPKPQVKALPVSDMHVSKLNMRHGKKPPNIDDIYPSILQGGINQSMLVRKEGKGWGVIAGRRRLFALKKKAKETGQAVTAPCVIMPSGNTLAAREASLLENVARVPATQLEQFAAYKALADSGKDASEIAATFAIPELSVKRVLALAALAPEILDLFEAEKIDGRTLQTLTLASDDQQAAWLKLWHSEDYAPRGAALKDWLTGGAQIRTDAALFELEDYQGQTITDLFGETTYFVDADAFWACQNKAIADAVATWKAEGWSDVVVLERGTRFDSWEHSKREREQGGKIYLAIGHDGTVDPHIGYLPKADIKKIEAILNKGTDKDATATTTKPEMSGPLTQYVALHRLTAIRSCLLDHPKVALRLTVAHMLVGSDLWTVAPQSTTSRKDATSESVAASKGAQRFETERAWVHDLLGVKAPSDYYSPNKKLAVGDVADLFAKLLDVDDNAVMRVMTLAMAESLAAGADIVEAIPHAVPVDMGTLWEPDDAFFDILRDKRVINAMLADIAGKSCANGMLTDTGKAQKNAIRNRMKGIGVNKDKTRPDWRPRWMQVPARHYLDMKTCPPAKSAKAIETLMRPVSETRKAA